MKKFENNSAELLIHFCLYAMTFAIPLVFIPIGIEQFTLPKLAVTAFFITLMMLLLTLRMLTDNESLHLGTLIGLFVVGFLGLVTISYWQSFDRITGLYGHFNRHDGLLTYAILGSLFLVVTQFKWEDRALKNLLLSISAGAMVVCFIAIAGYLGLDFFQLANESGRATSTLGHPVYLGSYLVMAFFCTVTLAFLNRSKLYYFASSLIFLVTVLTGSRSAIFGLIVGSTIIIAHYRRSIMPSVRLLRVIAISVTLLVLVVQIQVVRTDRASLWQRFSISKISSDLAGRTRIAQTGLRAIKERPLFGVGPSNYPWAHQKFQDQSEGRSTQRTGDAHNFLLQTAATLGLPALAVFLAIIWLSVRKCRRLIMRNKLFTALLGGIIGFLASILFEPTNISALMIFWLFIGIVASQRENGRFDFRLRKPMNAIVTSGIMISTILISVILARWVMADQSFAQGENLRRQNQTAAAVDSYLGAISLAPHVDRYYLTLGDFFISRARLNRDEEVLTSGIYYLNKATEVGKMDPQNWVRLSRAYQYATETHGKNFGDFALDAAKESVDLAPFWPKARRALGAVLLSQGHTQEALEHLKMATSVDSGYAEGWFWLGLAYEKLGDSQNALHAYNRSKNNPMTKFDAENRIRTISGKR